MAMELNEAPQLVLSALGKVRAKRCCIGFWTCGTRLLRLNGAENTINDLQVQMQTLVKTRSERAEIIRTNTLARDIGEQVKSTIKWLQAAVVDQNLTSDYRDKLNAVLEDLERRKPDETTRLLEQDAPDSSETQSKQRGGGYQQDFL